MCTTLTVCLTLSILRPIWLLQWQTMQPIAVAATSPHHQISLCTTLLSTQHKSFTSKFWWNFFHFFCFFKFKLIWFIFKSYKLHSFQLDLHSLGIIRWEFVVPLLVIWITIFISVRKHLTFSRHSTNCLAIIPFAFVFILVFRALMLPGAEQGIQHFLTPTWDGILKPQVWLFAAGLCLHSIGSVLGTSISMAKCNKESNHFVK